MKEFEKNSKIEDLVDTSIDKIKTLVEANTIIGETIVTEDGKTIIPVSKISVGFVSGGGEYSDNSSRRVANHYPMAGGSGGGISVNPIGFLIDDGTSIRFINVGDTNAYQTVLNLINKLIDKIGEKNNEKN